MPYLHSRKTVAFLIAFVVSTLTANAQTAEADTTIERLKRRTDFAKMYVGTDFFQTGSGTTQFNTATGSENSSFGRTGALRVLFGATHFWGHADFYIAIPVLQQQPAQLPGKLAVSYSEGLESGLRVFPWAIEAGKLRPFVGVSFKGVSYVQVDAVSEKLGTPPAVARTVFPVQVGLWYASRRWLVQAGVNYQSHNQYSYPTSRTGEGSLSVSPWSVNVGASLWFNTNGGMASRAGVTFMKNGPKKLARTHHLNTWYAGIGPSAAFELTKSNYVREKYPFLVQDGPGSLLPDLTVGRYFHKPDLNVGLSYRSMSGSTSGYGVKLNYQRRSYMLEAYKFLGDYHGFVPFVGPTLAYEDLTFTNSDGGVSTTTQTQKVAIGIIFGWDIRLSRAETWLLRTNLRYTPNLHLLAEGKKVQFDQLEFNFIQFVWFPGRARALRQ